MLFFKKNVPKQAFFLLAVLAGVTWGTHGAFSLYLGKYGIGDGTIAVISPLFLFVFFFFVVAKDDICKLIFPKKMIPVLLLYGLVTALFNLAIVKAYFLMPAGIVHTIVFGNIFLLMIFSKIFFRIPLTVVKAVLCLLAVAGIAMTLNVFGAGGGFSLQGVVWALLTMIAWAGMVLCEKIMLEGGADGNAILVYDGGLGVLFLSFLTPPAVIVGELSHAFSLSGGTVLLPLAGLALIPSVISYYLYIEALKRMEPTYVQMGYVMDPLTATILGVILFHETLSPQQIVGIALVLILVVIVQVMEIRAAREGASSEP